MLLLILSPFILCSLMFLIVGSVANADNAYRNLGSPGFYWSISLASLLPVSGVGGVPVGFMIANLVLLGVTATYWALDTEETAR